MNLHEHVFLFVPAPSSFVVQFQLVLVKKNVRSNIHYNVVFVTMADMILLLHTCQFLMFIHIQMQFHLVVPTSQGALCLCFTLQLVTLQIIISP